MSGGAAYVLHRRELDRLVLGNSASCGVADEDLERGQYRCWDEGDREAAEVVTVSPAAQDTNRVHPSDRKTAHHVGGQDHVGHLIDIRVVEEDLPGIDGDDLAPHFAEPARLVHPRVDSDYRKGPDDAAHRDGHPA